MKCNNCGSEIAASRWVVGRSWFGFDSGEHELNLMSFASREDAVAGLCADVREYNEGFSEDAEEVFNQALSSGYAYNNNDDSSWVWRAIEV